MARTKAAQRREAAEEVCWAAMLMIGLGGLECVPMEWRPVLAEPLGEWARLATETGIMRAGAEGAGASP